MREFIPEHVNLIPNQAELKFSGRIFDVYQWPQKLFDGSVATFEMLKRPDTVVIIAIMDEHLIITRQKQPGKNWYYGFPGGRVDASDVNELAAAKRELREETGMTFQNWRLLNVVQPFTKIDWLVYTFLATDFLEQTVQKLDAGERVEVSEISFDELQKYISRPDAKDLRKTVEELGIDNMQQLLDLPMLYDYKS